GDSRVGHGGFDRFVDGEQLGEPRDVQQLADRRLRRGQMNLAVDPPATQMRRHDATQPDRVDELQVAQIKHQQARPRIEQFEKPIAQLRARIHAGGPGQMNNFGRALRRSDLDFEGMWRGRAHQRRSLTSWTSLPSWLYDTSSR